MQLLYKSRRTIARVFFIVYIITSPQLAYAGDYLGLSDKQLRQLLSNPEKLTAKKTRKALRTKTKKVNRIVKISKITDKAKQMLHVPYRWGGTSPKGFDCSGLVQYAFKRAGVVLPRTAAAQYKATRRVEGKYTALGDLLFFHTRRRGSYINHVGIYLGRGQFIHAPGRGKRVRISTLSNYWKRKIVGVGRTI